MRRKPYFVLLLLIVFALPSRARAISSASPKSDPVVLEIITTAGGMVYPRPGDLLVMRLYESGRFEYDDYPAQDPPKVTVSNVTITKREARLNPEAVKELISLAEQPDFLSAKGKYSSSYRHFDSTWVITIKFKYRGHRKKIVAVNFWDIRRHKEDRSNYPPSMVTLLERAYELKAKALGKL